MKYQIPEIAHIQQALNAIKGDEDKFLIIDKGEFTTINYKLPCNATFPPVIDINTAIRRELRGIKFYSDTGLIAQRLLTKFFNYGEREETLQQNVDLAENHIVLEKLDGSLVAPIKLRDGIRWTTKAGITDVSMQVEVHLASGKNQGVSEYVIDALNDRYTPMFEWLSIQNKVVLHHDIDRLVLIAVRNNFTGVYLTHNQMVRIGEAYNLEVVKKLSHKQIENIALHAESVYNYDGELTEGQIVRFEPSGHMLKLKTEKYLNLHRTKDKIQKERHFVSVLLSQQLDDLKPFMLAEDLAKAEKYEETLVQNINTFCNNVASVIEDLKENNTSRKDFALGATQLDPMMKQIVFHLWDKGFPVETIYPELLKRLKDSCETDQKFERLRNTVIKGCVW